jgi:hypothetical protein
MALPLDGRRIALAEGRQLEEQTHRSPTVGPVSASAGRPAHPRWRHTAPLPAPDYSRRPRPGPRDRLAARTDRRPFSHSRADDRRRSPPASRLCRARWPARRRNRRFRPCEIHHPRPEAGEGATGNRPNPFADRQRADDRWRHRRPAHRIASRPPCRCTAQPTRR